MTGATPRGRGEPGARYEARTVAAIAEIGAETWDRLAGDDNPFVGFDFLDALEQSGCCRARTGWMPCHLVLEDGTGTTVGVMPLYLKSHSYGEYVFDHGWADAYERAGGRYYPKAQCSVPFSPVTGPRLLVGPDADGEEGVRARQALLSAALQATDRFDASSLHVTFPTEAEWRLMGEAGMLLRTGEQFHWHNRGYGTFDDFLAGLTARKRKMIRKERARAVASDITVRTLTGDDLKPEHWDAFFEFYMDTGSRKWGAPYLNRAFFDQLHQRLRHRVALVMCERDGRYIAGALNLVGRDTLYGRNWGCIEDHDFLHFEACYYRAIDFAIEHGLAHVEAGAQGPHKLQRGYLPKPIYSAHWIADPGLRDAVARYLDAERRQVAMEIEALTEERSPYRKEG